MAYLDKYSDKELLEILDSDVEQELHNRGYEYGYISWSIQHSQIL